MFISMMVTALMSFAVSSFLFYFFHPKAIQFGLVDKADHRKLHKGNIPVIGGPALYCTLVFVLYMNQQFTPEVLSFVLCGGFLMLLGMIDDNINLKVSLRLSLMIAITTFLYYFAEFQISSLGNLFSLGEVVLNSASLIFTIIVVIGVISAFNMVDGVDGVDGLLGCLSIISFLALAVLFGVNGQLYLASTCICFIAALIPFLMCNLSMLPRNRYKVFMGDSGSFFIGFTVVCLLIAGSQESMHIDDVIVDPDSPTAFKPVTALWLIAVPVLDMIANIIRRVKNKKSPLHADRGHIHHLLQDMDLSDKQVLILLSAFAIFSASVGVIGGILHVPEVIMFSLLILLLAVYYYFYSHSDKFSGLIHRLFGHQLPTS